MNAIAVADRRSTVAGLGATMALRPLPLGRRSCGAAEAAIEQSLVGSGDSRSTRPTITSHYVLRSGSLRSLLLTV